LTGQPPQTAPATATNWHVYFSPDEGCTEAVVLLWRPLERPRPLS
jgi:hypothetical protein